MEYQWLFRKYKEVDYSIVENRQIPVIFKFKQQNITLRSYYILPHRNQMIVAYEVDDCDDSRFFDVYDLTTRESIKTYEFKECRISINYRRFNNVDYIFYQRQRTFHFVRYDDLEEREAKHLIRFNFYEEFSIQKAFILDESTITMKCKFSNQTRQLVFQLDKQVTSITFDQRLEFDINFISQGNYQKVTSQKSIGIFVKDSNQSYFQLPCGNIDSFDQNVLRNHFLFYRNSKTLFIDKVSLEVEKTIEKIFHVVNHKGHYEYLMDSDLNLYSLDRGNNMNLTKVHQLSQNQTQQFCQVVTTPNKIFVEYKLKTQVAIVQVYDARTFQLLNEINEPEGTNIEIVPNNTSLYFKLTNNQFRLFNLNSNYDYFNNVQPLIFQGEHLLQNQIIDSQNNYLLYDQKSKDAIVVQDMITGKCLEINKEYEKNCIEYLSFNQNFLNDSEFYDKIKQFPKSQQVQTISPDDIIVSCQTDCQIILNANRVISLEDLRKQSDLQYENKPKYFCLMSDRYNKNKYVLDILSKNKVAYFDKTSQEFKILDLNDQLLEGYPIQALIDLQLYILLIQYDTQTIVFSLETKLRINEISAIGQTSSIFIDRNYLQISTYDSSNVYFFNDGVIDKVFQIKFPQNLEVICSFQNSINKTTQTLLKRKDKLDSSELYTMIESSFESINNDQNLIQPLYLAFYFENTFKIIIDSSNVQIFANGDHQTCGFFDLQVTDQLIDDYKSIQKMNNEQIIKEISLDAIKYTKFIAGYGTCFNMFQNNLIVLEVIVKQLSLREKQTLPILVTPNMLGQPSPLDFSIKNRQQKIINLILSIILKYQDHIIFNQFVDKSLCELFKQQIDLQEYFDSNLPSYQILDPSFPIQHQDEKELIVGINLDHPKDVHQKYQQLFGEKLKVLSHNEEDSLNSIEYNLINLPKTLQKNPTELMKVLSDSEKPEYFENQIIQSIINFKWKEYTLTYYKTKFYIYLIFMAAFIFDIFYTTYSSKTYNDEIKLIENEKLDHDPQEHQPNILLKISTKIICCLVLFSFLIHEVRQIRIQKASYLIDIWNYFDFSHIVVFILFCILEFTNEDSDILILNKILLIILSFMKLFYFLRIYDGFSFLVQMMAGVFKDLKYFISFFLIFILLFGMIFLVLFKADSIDEYKGVNGMAYFLMAFRISSGDFQLDDYQKQGSTLVIFSWILWILAVLTLNIVFMNFIIAVISESYERVMQKLISESYKVKANMILEREELLSIKELERKDFFPNYIVVRRQINNEANEVGEWQGFIKDLKYTVRTTVSKSKNEIISTHSSELSSLKRQFDELQKEDIVSLKHQIQQDGESNAQVLKEEIYGIQDDIVGLKQNMDLLKGDMDFLKISISQILQKLNN
ncbi:wd-40 repeat protein [Stylonychia lemnae]|uniref:Wd-40 repeat protein n=1 Tax=Stylonychia lemnae TaxID=5949 RepID=A0A078BE89_STYLE|nr:wd-40 repeat protein [Stylonychia lemnae]|eukprot:CDW91442.1 wd-40 repeat protein [Stylonychia lemnae]